VVVHYFIKMATEVFAAPRRLKRVRTGRKSASEFSVSKIPALVSRLREFNRDESAVARDFIKSLCPALHVTEKGSDMVFSKSRTVTTGSSLRAAGNAAVFEKHYSLQSFNTAINALYSELVQFPGTNIGGDDNTLRNLATLSFDLSTVYTYKNMTNTEVSLYVRQYVSKHSHGTYVYDAWDADTTASVGMAEEFSANTSLALPVDGTAKMKHVLSPDWWEIGSAGSRVAAAFTPKSPWLRVVLAPGESTSCNVVFKGSLSVRDLDIYIASATSFKGMPTMLVKAVGEIIYNNTNTVEDTAETSGSGSSLPFTTAPVQLFETMFHTARYKLYPGFPTKSKAISADAYATNGMVNGIAELDYATAGGYVRINPDGNGIVTYADIGNYTTTESNVDEAAGANEQSNWIPL